MIPFAIAAMILGTSQIVVETLAHRDVGSVRMWQALEWLSRACAAVLVVWGLALIVGWTS